MKKLEQDPNAVWLLAIIFSILVLGFFTCEPIYDEVWFIEDYENLFIALMIITGLLGTAYFITKRPHK